MPEEIQTALPDLDKMKSKLKGNRMYGGVRGRKTKVGRKLLRFPPTR